MNRRAFLQGLLATSSLVVVGAGAGAGLSGVLTLGDLRRVTAALKARAVEPVYWGGEEYFILPRASAGAAVTIVNDSARAVDIWSNTPILPT